MSNLKFGFVVVAVFLVTAAILVRPPAHVETAQNTDAEKRAAELAVVDKELSADLADCRASPSFNCEQAAEQSARWGRNLVHLNHNDVLSADGRHWTEGKP